jgi:hypothetical protein
MTEDRRRLGGPPEDHPVDRLAGRAWDGLGQLLHKLLGRYYDPVDRNVALLVLFFAVMGAAGFAIGADGATQLLGASAALTALWGVLAYRRDQRWRA